MEQALQTDSSDLETTLNNAGLDAERWILLLEKYLKITSSIQLKHTTKNDYNKIKRYAQQDWEQNALKKVMGVICCSLDEETNMLKACQNQCSDEEKINRFSAGTRLTQLRSENDTPQENRGTSNLNAELEKFKSRQNENRLEKERDTSKHATATEIVQIASGGLMTRGVLRTEKIDDELKIRYPIVKVPDEIQQKNPIMPTQEDELEITSKTMDETVNKSLDGAALSLLASGKLGFKTIGLQAEVFKE